MKELLLSTCQVQWTEVETLKAFHVVIAVALHLPKPNHCTCPSEQELRMGVVQVWEKVPWTSLVQVEDPCACVRSGARGLKG